MSSDSSKDKPQSVIGKYWSEFRQYGERLFEPFDEFERIARNKPHPSVVKKNLPKVTDGTLSNVINKKPKKVVQQLPSGKVMYPDDEYYELLGDFMLNEEIIPNANRTADMYQKSLIMVQKSLTYGSQPAYVMIDSHGDYTGADMVTPYVRDVFLEPGKLSDYDSEIIFMRAYYTEPQIDAIIKNEARLKELDEGYKTTWDVAVLNELKAHMDAKDPESETPDERNRSEQAPGAELLHCFKRGKGEYFYTYSPKLDKNVRERVNPDPRGVIPIHYMYADMDMSNPLGRGLCEVAGGMQNLLDSQVQSFQYSQALMLNPPILKRGDVRNNTIKLVPKQIIDLGSDPNANVEPLKLDTSAQAQFSNNYSLMKSQILNMLDTDDQSTSAEVGNPGFSKTPAGVEARQELMDIDTAYLRKMYEAWWEQVAETMVNIHMQQLTGVQEVQLTQEYAERFEKLAEEDERVQLSEDNKLIVNFDEIQDLEFSFEVEPTTSRKKEQATQTELNMQLLELASSSEVIYQNVKVNQLVDRIVKSSGVEKPEELLPTDEELEAQALQQQQLAEQEAVAQQQAQAQVPQEAPVQEGGLSAEELQYAQQLVQAGLTEEQAGEFLALVRSGMSEEEALAQVTGGQL